MIARLTMLAVLVLTFGCTTLEVRHEVETEEGEPVEIIVTTLTVPGKGCLYVDSEVTIAETDGMSINLTSFLKFLPMVAGSIFGSNVMTDDPLEAGQGCGVVKQLYGSRAEVRAPQAFTIKVAPTATAAPSTGGTTP